VVEGNVARMRDGSGGQLLASAARAGDECREVAHALIERATVAAHVVREYRLPDGGAQPGGGERAADDVGEDAIEGALDLAKAGEGVAGIECGREDDTVDRQEVAPVGEEVLIEAPAAGTALGETGVIA